jgi:uncharacterized repeat protein (TIGR04138 family)
MKRWRSPAAAVSFRLGTGSVERGAGMEDTRLEEGIRGIVRDDPRFHPNAYFFIFEALEFTLARLKARRHVSGKELLEGVREYALESFGYLVRAVFYEWGITATEDIGEIVFNLVNADLLLRNENDTLADFRDGYDFEEAFDQAFEHRFRKALPDL